MSSMLMDFRRNCTLGTDREREGRPMVWETRKVCEEASHNWFASLGPYLLPHYLLTSKTRQDKHRPLMHPADVPRMQSEPDVDRYRFATVSASSTSLVCKREPAINVHLLHLPRIQKRAGGGLFSHSIGAGPPLHLCRFQSEPDVDSWFLHLPHMQK